MFHAGKEHFGEINLVDVFLVEKASRGRHEVMKYWDTELVRSGMPGKNSSRSHHQRVSHCHDEL